MSATILSIIGTRPEGIKMAPVIKSIEGCADNVQSVVCVTGQHREMLDQVLHLFALFPDFDLDIIQPNQRLSKLTARLCSELDTVVETVKPAWILAQGDTTTVLAAALAAHYNRIPFGHVEAGLRTGDKYQPFPEEMNRRLADQLADLHFAPTERARQALLREGIREDNIFITGNTGIDALLAVAEMECDWNASPLASLPSDHRLVLITAHRRESFGAPLREICLAIQELARRYERQNVSFVFPVHLNPNVQQPVYSTLSGIANVFLLEPLDYLSLVHLMKRATLILTDSGGIQEEAPSLGVPILVLRDTTERPEGVEAGVAKLVGTDKERIVAETVKLLDDHQAHQAMALRVNPYGDGKAASRIVSILLDRIAT